MVEDRGAWCVTKSRTRLRDWTTTTTYFTLVVPQMLLCLGLEIWPEEEKKWRERMNWQDNQIRSVAQSCPTLCDPMNRSTPGLPVHHQLPELTQMLGAGMRHSAHGKGHEEGGSTYAKAGSSLRSPPGNPQASTPITRACLLYYFVLSPTPLTLRGAVPHHLLRRRS